MHLNYLPKTDISPAFNAKIWSSGIAVLVGGKVRACFDHVSGANESREEERRTLRRESGATSNRSTLRSRRRPRRSMLCISRVDLTRMWKLIVLQQIILVERL